MRQILLNMNGAVVARMPRPLVQRGGVLVRVRYSLVSVGTEVAPLRPASVADPDSSAVERGIERAELLKHYLRASIRDPRKAGRRLSEIVRRRLDRMTVPPAPSSAPPDALVSSDLRAQGWAVGYSAAGEVVEVGADVTDLSPGDQVACAGAGAANHADYISVPRNLVCRIPSGVDARAAASTTIGAIALQGVRRAAPELGDRVVVLGLGLIGQITTQLLRCAGATVIGLDLDETRTSRALSLGLDAASVSADDLKAKVRDMTAGHGADRTLITAATKSDAVINLAMDVTRAKGRVVIVGDVGLDVDRAAFYRKELDLLMSTSYGPGRYDAAYEIEGRDYPYPYVRWTLNRNMESYLELVASGGIRIEPLIDRVVSIDDAPAVYEQLAKAEGSLPLGVVIEYDDPPDAGRDAGTRVLLSGHRAAPAERIRYALVGAGSFATAMLVPQMRKRKDRFFLRAVVSRTGTAGSNFAREQQAEVLTSNLDDVLTDPDVDLIVVATRHHEHADQVARALRAGKHVFVEKPLSISAGGLDAVAAAYREMREPRLLLVGFNRRFSPSLQLLRDRLAGRRSPLMIEYRLNAGYIARDHWVQGDQGGGRNIGEACHMYDVFRFLAGAPVRSVSATAIDPGALPHLRSDNFSATIGYEDGSVATLLYTALGPKSMGKELITVFADGEAYVLDDYKRLSRASDGEVLWSAGEADKGHFEELSRFGDAIATGGPSPISFEELLETTALALRIEAILHGHDDEPA